MNGRLDVWLSWGALMATYMVDQIRGRRPGVNPGRFSLAKQLSLALEIPEFCDDDDDLSITRK